MSCALQRARSRGERQGPLRVKRGPASFIGAGKAVRPLPRVAWPCGDRRAVRPFRPARTGARAMSGSSRGAKWTEAKMVMAVPSDRNGAVGTLPQTERRDFSAVGYAEAMRRAREIVPILRERAARAEDARTLLRRYNQQLLHESGLFRFHQPKSFGGMELDFVAVVDIPAELARGCPSTAWNIGQRRLPSLDPRILRSRNPARSVGREPGRADRLVHRTRRRPRPEGGRRLRHQRSLAVLLGGGNSDWNMLAVSIYADDEKTPIDWRLCLVPKSDYEIVDTWYAMGMAATGSKDVAVSGAIRAGASGACRFRAAAAAPSIPAPPLNPGALYRIPIVAASSHPLAPAALGAAEGAYELFLETMAKRAGTYTGAQVADFQAVQIKVARARCLIDSARDLLRQSAIGLQAAASSAMKRLISRPSCGSGHTRLSP